MSWYDGSSTTVIHLGMSILQVSKQVDPENFVVFEDILLTGQVSSIDSSLNMWPNLLLKIHISGHE